MSTARSYCSGYGGLEMSVRAAFGDFEVLSHSDIKPASERLLAHHYPHIPNLGDMRAIDYTALERPDLMIGSWPCQPHSAAGKRLGEADPRDLWPEYLRAIDAHRPAIFFGENVARIASNGELRRVVRSLARRGYVGAWRVLSAADVRACHLRKRCFIVAVAADTTGGGRGTWGAAEQGLGQPSASGRFGPADGDRPALTLLPTPKATDGTKGGPGMRGSSGDLMLPSAVMQLLPTPSASAYGTNQGGAAGRVGPVRESLDTMARNGRLIDWGMYAAAIARHEQAFGRPAPEPTQISLKNGNPQLSARFVEWMMMVPEGHVTGVPGLVDSPRRSERNAMLSLLGDGVVPAQGAAAFSFLLAHLAQRLAAGVAA